MKETKTLSQRLGICGELFTGFRIQGGIQSPEQQAQVTMRLRSMVHLPHLYDHCGRISTCPGLAGVVLRRAGWGGLVSAVFHHPGPAPQGSPRHGMHSEGPV